MVHADKIPQWPLPDPPSHYASRACNFATFVCDLLRQRRIVPRCAPNYASDGSLIPVGAVDELASQWFDAAKVSGLSLPDLLPELLMERTRGFSNESLTVWLTCLCRERAAGPTRGHVRSGGPGESRAQVHGAAAAAGRDEVLMIDC